MKIGDVVEKQIIDLIVSNIHKNYPSIVSSIENEDNFLPIAPVRREICLCLMCGFYQAAIVLTNHLLESALKKFLILVESRGNKVATSDIANTFKYATDKYAGEILKNIIDKAYSKGLILESEKDMLHQFRQKYRNPFSHANPKQTFPEKTLSVRLVSQDEISNPEDFAKFFAGPNMELDPQNFLPIQGLLQALMAQESSADYFFKVDEILCSIYKRITTDKL